MIGVWSSLCRSSRTRHQGNPNMLHWIWSKNWATGTQYIGCLHLNTVQSALLCIQYNQMKWNLTILKFFLFQDFSLKGYLQHFEKMHNLLHNKGNSSLMSWSLSKVYLCSYWSCVGLDVVSWHKAEKIFWDLCILWSSTYHSASVAPFAMCILTKVLELNECLVSAEHTLH